MPMVDWENDPRCGPYRIISKKDYDLLSPSQRELVDQYASELRQKETDMLLRSLKEFDKQARVPDSKKARFTGFSLAENAA